jgi:SAM-dependent methyltransferase
VTKRPTRILDIDRALGRLRQELYRNAYYAKDGESTDQTSASRPNGWASLAAQQRAHQVFHRVLSRHPGGAVLDLGCGDGALLRSLVAASAGAFVPYGVDFLPESIEAARAQTVPADRDHFTVADATDFDPGRHFAVVLTSLCYALPHMRRRFVAQCRRWLEPHGRLVLYEYRGSPLFEDLSEICVALRLPIEDRVRDGDVALVTMASHASPGPHAGS